MLTVNSLCVEAHNTLLLDHINFSLDTGECLCVIGESGSGKTTLLKSLQGIMPISGGSIRHGLTHDGAVHVYQTGHNYLGLPGVSWVMQNPIAALNPHQTVGDAILEGLYRAGFSKSERQARLLSSLEEVELPKELITRKPSQLSLGQAQRVCIARALISRPKMIIFDEPLSALDAVVQKQIARVIDDIRHAHGLSYLFVTHDLGFARAYADRILLLRNGKMEACQEVDDFFSNPASSYGAELIHAAAILGALEHPIALNDDTPRQEAGQ
ncbi:MAG: dipeptide/oligopeptide/nickel ABC transporter ATP-binding protein [Cohaesibacter sp.]|nr:dipeptide/oligopeptide/nickel ABC transporter ATP-binding protein [Cohaesibacter sp.]